MSIRRQLSSFLAALIAVAFAACASTVSPNDGGHDVVRRDTGMACVLQDDTLCPAGTSCPAPDGCNTCTCSATDQHLSCTLLDCAGVCHSSSECGAHQVCAFHDPGCGMAGRCENEVLCDSIHPYCGCDNMVHVGPCNGPDAPFVRLGDCGCTSNADCTTRGDECVFEPGCGSPHGHCQPLAPCTEPAPFCGCDGQTYLACESDRPLSAVGACAVPDGGTMTDCNPQHAFCASLPPECGEGNTPSVIGGCWGPCVPFMACAPIPCDPTGPSGCPNCTACNPRGFCDYQCGL